jgi:adenylate kinase
MDKKKINLILFGPMGSGRRTQARKLAKKYKLLHLSIDDLMDEEAGKETTLGLEAKSYLDKNLSVPSSITIAMLDQRIEANPDVDGCVFDRFPVTIQECEALDEYLQGKGQAILKLIHLEVENTILIKRQPRMASMYHLFNEKMISQLSKAFEVLRLKVAPVYDYYAASGRATKILGEGSVDRVFANLCTVVDKLV